MNHCSWKCSYTVQISRKHLCVHTIIELDQCLPLLIAKYHRLFISLSHPSNMRLLTAIFNRLTSFLGSICRLWCATHMLGYAEAVNTARHKSLIDLLKPQATAESNSYDRTSGHHTDALLWATVYIFLFYMPFSLSKHVVLHTFAFPNTSHILSSHSHSLFHMFSLSFSQTLTRFWHSYFPPIQSLSHILFLCTPTFLTLYCFPHYFSSSFCLQHKSLPPIICFLFFYFISYLPNLSPSDN